MKLVVQQFLTLDGVSQGPGSPDEDTSDGFTRGGWFVPYVDQEFMEISEDWLGRADGLLFGRRTYENFARDWPTMTDHPFGKTMNGLPKYVATQSLTGADWNPTTILAGNIAAEVDALKQQPGRELQIHGSSRLAQSLLAAGLVDELRLAIAPVVVGRGRRLFPDGGTPAGLHLLSQRSTAGGLSVHVFETAGMPAYGVYEG
ncbi:dihydrofolate reductase family protein [Streptomyces sp. NPDC051684]|uniref:dihydrofolate reductase family protein n=1 Tax=Streptomyces sp. NPDC051684 TaxID=3365670 RepID=UPI003787ECF8